MAAAHYENFPTASLLIRKDLRPAVAAIYAFARTADDYADEGDMPKQERLRLLQAWEDELDLSRQCLSQHAVFIALADVLQRYDIPVQLLRDLLTAFRMDVQFQGFSSYADLLDYARHSANPVGRMMLYLHGIDEKHALLASDAICTGLQLTNFWQDFSIDIAKGRCYLADEWLDLAHVSRHDVCSGKADYQQLKPAIDVAIHQTQQRFDAGYALLAYLPFRLRLQIAATLVGGETILQHTAALPNPLLQRPSLSKWSWLKASFRILYVTLRFRAIIKTKG